MKKSLLPILLFSAALALAGESRPMNLLWFGSSSTPPQLIHFFNQMLDATGEYKVVWSDKANGYFNTAYFVKHGEKLERNVGNGKSMEEFIGELNRQAAQRKFDYVIVQVRHHTAMYPEIAEKAPQYIKTFCDAIRATGAEPVFYIAPGFKNKTQQKKLTDLVTLLAKENNARVAWGTETLLDVMELKGAEYVQNKKADDAGHVGPFGNYTYACALYAAVTGKSPVGHPLREITTTTWNVRFGDDIPNDGSVYNTVIPEDDALFIQQTAWKIYEQLKIQN